MAEIKVRLYLTDTIPENPTEEEYLDFYNEDIIRLNTISYTTTQPDTVQYGAFSNDGTIGISDKNSEILNKIHEGLFDSYKYPIEIYLDDKKIATHIIKTRPNYDFANREITINLADKLYAMDDLQYEGYVYPLESKTAQDVLADILGKYDDEWGVNPHLVFNSDLNTNVPEYNENSLKWIDFKRKIPTSSVYFSNDYRLAEIQYPYLAPQTFREASASVLSLMHTSLITDENGAMTPVFMDRYAENVEDSDIIIIPIDKTIKPLNPTVILDNKHDNAEIGCKNIIVENRINVPIDKVNSRFDNEEWSTDSKKVKGILKAPKYMEIYPVIRQYEDSYAYFGHDSYNMFSYEQDYFYKLSWEGEYFLFKIMFLDKSFYYEYNTIYQSFYENSSYKNFYISKYTDNNLSGILDINKFTYLNLSIVTKIETYKREIDVKGKKSYASVNGEYLHLYLPSTSNEFSKIKEEYKSYINIKDYVNNPPIQAEDNDISFNGQKIILLGNADANPLTDGYPVETDYLTDGYSVEDEGKRYKITIGKFAKREFVYYLYQTSFGSAYVNYEGQTNLQKCYQYIMVETPYAITINVNGTTQTITFNDESIKDNDKTTNNVLTYGDYGNMLQYEYTQDNIKAEINKYLDYYGNGIHTADITVFGGTDYRIGGEKSVSIDYVGNNMSISKVTTKLENIDSDSVQIMTYSISPKEEHFGGTLNSFNQWDRKKEDAEKIVYNVKDNIIFTEKGIKKIGKGEELTVFSINVITKIYNATGVDKINGVAYSNFFNYYLGWSAKLTAKFEGTTITFTYEGNKAFELTVPVYSLTSKPFKCGDVVEVQNYDGGSDLYYRHGLQKGNPIKWQVTRNELSFDGGNVEQALTLRELPVISEYKNITVYFYSDASTFFSLEITDNGKTRNLLNNEDFSVSGSFSAYDKTYEFKNLKEKNIYDFGYIKFIRNQYSQAFFRIELYDKTKDDTAELSLTKSNNLQITSVKF